jgi:hypothetical protein
MPSNNSTLTKTDIYSTPYRKWSDCPPRAPLGRADALYGSHDHLVLLIGRIADFTCRDRERKLRQVQADGGQWRPRAGMPGGPPAGMSRSQPPTPGAGPPPAGMQGPPPGWTGGPPTGWKGPPPPGSGPPVGSPPTPRESPPRGPPPQMPNFFGMAPARPHAPITTHYANPNYERSLPTPNASNPQYADLPFAYDVAIAEWENINTAHATIAQVLSSNEAFAPLPPELQVIPPGQTSTMTPFGPALVHRSYDISILWTLLHLSKIILLRAHPAMPPAMMMAAGICAQATGPYATLIGRISAGISLPAGDLSPFLGSVLQEGTMGLFFAGVQYQDPAQREWIITRLLEIDRRTGWASAGVIARGVETSWERAAQMGRGPPYKRRTRRAGEDGPLVLEDESARPSTWRHKEGENAIGKGTQVQEVVEGNGERRFLVKPRMVTWAKNVFGTEEDLRAGMERVGLQ